MFKPELLNAEMPHRGINIDMSACMNYSLYVPLEQAVEEGYRRGITGKQADEEMDADKKGNDWGEKGREEDGNMRWGGMELNCQGQSSKNTTLDYQKRNMCSLKHAQKT